MNWSIESLCRTFTSIFVRTFSPFSVWTGDGFARDALRGFSPEFTKMVRNDPLLERFSQASKHEFP